jgi:SAM-dependent methyltransferase
VTDTAATPVPAGETLAVDDWDAHWDAYTEAAAHNPAQWFRRRAAIKLLGGAGTPHRLLDIGSGTGELLRDAAEKWPSAELAGVEMSARGNEFAAERVSGAQLHTVDLLKEETPSGLAGWATDAICSEVLEHVDDPALLLRRSQPMLEPGARVVVTVPGGKMSAFDKHIGHRRHFTPESLAKVFEDAGFEPIETTGLGFPFFNLYRWVVISRGEKLVEEVAAGDGGSSAARIVMAIFKPLLACTFASRRFGNQIVGVARFPG